MDTLQLANAKKPALSATGLPSKPRISLVQRRKEGCHSEGQGERGTAVAVSTQKETGSGGGEGHSEERQPPLVCDVSTAAKNSLGEKQQGAGWRWGWVVIGGE